MALPLPGDRARPRLVEVLLAAATVLGLCALGCATPTRTRRLPSSVFHASRIEPRGGHRGLRRPAGDESAALVERSLHDGGLRFGTDGSARALWGYMRTSHVEVAPADARPGDVVFFDTRGTDPEPDCADHAGLVESVDGDGRLGFLEARAGQVRHSFVHPERPTLRRGEQGQILNSFLRPKLVTDPPDARYFAGEMLCGVFRVRSR
jgi:hypothetical protein